MKSAYTRPRLVVYGRLEQITQGNSTGSALDATYEVGTKKGDLTFS